MKIIRKDFSHGSEHPQDMPYQHRAAEPVDNTIIFSFPDGIPAFESSKRFIIVLNPKIKPFVYLKSLDMDDLGFVCIDPFLICKDYSVKIPGKDLSILQLKNPGEAMVLCMVTVDKDPQNTTCNLLAPVIINVMAQVGRQVILEDTHPVRYRIWEGIESMESV